MHDQAEPNYGQASLINHSTGNLTLSQNIDRRIAEMKSQIERLEKVKALLQQPEGILNVPLNDLRFAMQY